ncbi:MAG: putative carbohydrate-binding protein with CBM5 and CBM33 domain/chitodextrinase [Phenylobacterium sp.]|jgi:predicted carbohydrate-binding protein with CBM5 and CBM33 domain/chitodextrinase
MKINTLKSLGLAAASIICILPSQLSAHGYSIMPKARQAFCLEQAGYWWPADGSAIPNAACRAAFLDSGHYQFTQSPEFAANVANYDSQAAVEAKVVDGTLCAGGDANKSGMNIPSADWQRTDVTPDANGNIQFVFNANTPHNPSFWKFYLTKPGFNTATDNPNWSDLELVQEYGNVPLSQDSSGMNVYQMDVALPTGRDGDAILFTRWQRNDQGGEGFYNCSDITIKGTGTTDPSWSAIGFYVSQGQTANVGDVVRVRLFSETGQELINQTLDIDALNLANWQESLANTLVTDHSQLIEVGVEDAQGEIVFDTADLAANQVWVQNSNHTFNLTVAPPTPNTAPNVAAIGDVSVVEGASVAINVSATDAEGDALTYQWDVSTDLTVNGSGASVSLVASQVDADAPNQVSVTVSDGQLSTTQSFTVTVTDVVEPVEPAWDAGTTYVGGNMVSYKGAIYRAKWWTLNEKPDSAQVWEKQ